MIGQYSVPFCVALAIVADARDPRTFRDADIHDPTLRRLMGRIRLVPWDQPRPTPIASSVKITFTDGEVVTREVHDFKGTPDNPLSHDELKAKFLLLTQDYDPPRMVELFERAQDLENQATLDWLMA